jgi:hypothetical protein
MFKSNVCIFALAPGNAIRAQCGELELLGDAPETRIVIPIGAAPGIIGQ